MFIKSKEGRRKCDMLLRLNVEAEFESSALSKLDDSNRASYNYYLARVKERESQCISDLDTKRLGFDICQDDVGQWAVRPGTSSAYEGFDDFSGLAASSTDRSLFTYSRESESLVKYQITTGQFSTLFSDPNKVPIADYYGITLIDDDTTLYLTCSSPKSLLDDEIEDIDDEKPVCGLLRYTINDDFLERPFKEFGISPISLCNYNNTIYIADPDAQTVWTYKHPEKKISKEDEVLPKPWLNVSNSRIRRPVSISASESYIWILDLESPILYRCTPDITNPECIRLETALFEDSSEIAARPNDAGVFVFDTESIKLHIVDNPEGNLVTLAEGPKVATASGSAISKFSAHVFDNILYFITDADDGSIWRLDNVHQFETPDIDLDTISTDQLITYNIITTWMACDDNLVESRLVPQTYADMIDYAKSYCLRAGLSFQAIFSLNFFNLTQAISYAASASKQGCASLKTQQTLCDAVANNPPYLCEHNSKPPLFDVLANAFANTELLFIAIIFFSAAALTCISHYYNFHPPPAALLSQSNFREKEEVATKQPFEQEDLEIRVALLEKKLFMSSRESAEQCNEDGHHILVEKEHAIHEKESEV
uniref:Uncharacterized protein n=1 Tax=Aureoumbra lagunensis TaxID=44058 RepID=A0A6S8C7R7_9STRA